MKKNISILGSTGSVGKNTLEVIDRLKLISIEGLAVNSNIELLEKQILKYKPKIVAVFNEEKAEILKKKLLNTTIKIVSGIEGVIEVATLESVDFVMSAMSGTSGLIPTYEAIKAKKTIGLANKETLVSAGQIVTQLAAKLSVKILPVDSEHSAIFQCLRNERSSDIKRLIITASGGPFRNKSKKELNEVTLRDALSHPTYSMGKKISIDSSTLMNKGLEVIEAHYLFNLPPSQIDVIIHPESLVHSFVEYKDGAMLAQISPPDMKLPISYALTYPNRDDAHIENFDFIKHNAFNFFPVDNEKFPCLSLAYYALKKGGSMPCYLNAANEVLVSRFLHGDISWVDIGTRLKKLIASHKLQDMVNLKDVIRIDQMAKTDAQNIY